MRALLTVRRTNVPAARAVRPQAFIGHVAAATLARVSGYRVEVPDVVLREQGSGVDSTQIVAGVIREFSPDVTVLVVTSPTVTSS
jgi:hypothetical protein